MKLLRLSSLFTVIALLIISDVSIAQTTVTFGTGTSSSSTRGPFQRSDTNSSSVYSRNILLYTAVELSAAGVVNGATITELQWEKGNSNVIIGSGDANLKLYMRNSSALTTDTTNWSTYIPGSTLVLDSNFNTTNNFPATSGWMSFPLNTPFVYTGGAIEIAIDWNSSQVSTPQFGGNGAVTWRWTSTTGNTLVQRVSGSSAPNDLNRLKSERANTRMTYNAVSCSPPTGGNVSSSTNSANFNWMASTNATSYNWKVVLAGAGSAATAIDSGTALGTNATATGLTELTSYDLYIAADCGGIGASSFAGPYSFLTLPINQDTVTIGMGTSSSSTRGPFQRSDTNSSTVFSRWVQVYTASELAAVGIVNGETITSLNWELASSNTIIGSGDANLKVYIKNSTATAATADTWTNLISGSALVVDNDYNTVNNFPGANGWMPFHFTSPFVYNGGAIEIAVDWDCSQVSTPAFSGDGSIKWRWESTGTDSLVVKRTGSSSAPSNISDYRTERANIQIVYEGTVCDLPTALMVNNVTNTTASLSWTASPNATSYNWRVVDAGSSVTSVAVDSGSTSMTSAMANGLTGGMAYDLYVEADCGSSTTSGFAGPSNFTTTTVGLSEAELNTGLKIAPNPTKGIVNFKLDLSKNSEVYISIYSIRGELIETFYRGSSSQLNYSVDLSTLSEGIYFAHVSVDGYLTTRKIVLSK